jgi:hypothetical protein
MCHKRILFIGFCLYLGLINGVTAQPSYLLADWGWPTEASTLLSGTFGETRSAHFHAGIDVKTWGREGYKVFASRDGILHRVGVSPYGYGKVVYLKHDDGSISLYAHLRDFESSIRNLVDSLRMQTFPFRFDEHLEQYNLRFKKGDVIAYSGSTGIGPPHLHFELRSPQERPFNPLLAKVSFKDTTPPRISGIAIEPLSIDAHINGQSRIVEIKPSSGTNFGTINVGGTIGLAVNASDYADGASNVYAVYSLELQVNGNRMFVSRADSFGYYNTAQMFLDRIYPILMSTRTGYQRLYIRDGNTLPFYEHDTSAGRLKLPPGDHQIRIIATDFSGNKTTASAILRVSSPRKALDEEVLRAPEIPISIPYLSQSKIRMIDWNNDGFSVPTQSSSKVDICISPSSLLEQGRCTRLNKAAHHRISLRDADSALIRVNGVDLGMFNRVYPNFSKTIYSKDKRASVHFDRGSVYDTLSVSFTADIIQGVKSAAIWPDHEPLKTPLQLSWNLDPSESNLDGWGWYYTLAGRKTWVSTQREGDIIRGVANRLGTYEVLRDQTPPELTNLSLKRDHAQRTIVSIRVRDDLSGVNFETTEFYVDGERGIIEYEPNGAELIWLHTNYRPRKGSNVAIKIADNAGNVRTFRGTIP